MTPRLDPFAADPAVMKGMLGLEAAIRKSGLESSLIHLIKTRASQINGCAYCIHMHTHEATEDGESALRLLMLDAWREAPHYTPRERAALAWTESLTRISETHAPDEDYEALAAEFSEAERVQLTLAIGAINAWNRIAIGFRSLYEPAAAAA
jgi:AhpD family alkylhydroperoxidase